MLIWFDFSQSTDSEPVYDQLNLDPRSHSDSDADHASSASPVCDSPYNTLGKAALFLHPTSVTSHV